MTLSKAIPSLIAIAGLVPAACALEITDDTLKLQIGLTVQARAENATAHDTKGANYSVLGGSDGANDPVNFSLPRVHLTFRGTYTPNWVFRATLQDEGVDQTGTSPQNSSTTANSNRGISTRYAWIQRVDKFDDLTNILQFGLDKPFFNDADYTDDKNLLFPERRAAAALLKARDVGAGYRLSGPVFTVGFDVQNGLNAKAYNANNQNTKSGYMTTARLELSPGAEWKPAAHTETYIGKEGHHLVLGADIGRDGNNLGAGATIKRSTMSYGADVLFHWNGLTTIAEFRAQKRSDESFVGAPTAELKSRIWDIQAGYAMPFAGTVIEPAVRFSKIDNNTDATETVNFGGDTTGAIGAGTKDPDHGASGKEFEAGVNFYPNGNNKSKFQLAVTRWSAESGDASATIVRLQQQFCF